MFNRIITLFLLGMSPLVFAREVALNFDDGVNPENNPLAKSINEQLLHQLNQHNVKAIIYPALIKTGEGEGLELVREWGRQGHKIGNHSQRHISLNKPEVTAQEYIQGIENAENIYGTMEGWVPRYRFPYLKEGNTVAKRDAVRNWLSQHHYQSGAVSIDASDWYYNQLFSRFEQLNDQPSLGKLKKAYIAHMIEKAHYYDELAKQTIGRSPKHVFLLHVNQINAHLIGDAITALRQEGWTIIDSDAAYQDPLYQEVVNIIPAGESIIWSIAKKKGVKTLRYPAEDAPYEHENLKAHGLLISIEK